MEGKTLSIVCSTMRVCSLSNAVPLLMSVHPLRQRTRSPGIDSADHTALVHDMFGDESDQVLDMFLK